MTRIHLCALTLFAALLGACTDGTAPLPGEERLIVLARDDAGASLRLIGARTGYVYRTHRTEWVLHLPFTACDNRTYFNRGRDTIVVLDDRLTTLKRWVLADFDGLPDTHLAPLAASASGRIMGTPRSYSGGLFVLDVGEKRVVASSGQIAPDVVRRMCRENRIVAVGPEAGYSTEERSMLVAMIDLDPLRLVWSDTLFRFTGTSPGKFYSISVSPAGDRLLIADTAHAIVYDAAGNRLAEKSTEAHTSLWRGAITDGGRVVVVAGGLLDPFERSWSPPRIYGFGPDLSLVDSVRIDERFDDSSDVFFGGWVSISGEAAYIPFEELGGEGGGIVRVPLDDYANPDIVPAGFAVRWVSVLR